MVKLAFSVLCASACLMALPVAAATPDAALLAAASAPDKPIQASVIKIGDRFCPAAPDKAASDKTAKMMKLVSATCVMEASGLISHDEAQSVYEQAMGTIQAAMAEIEMDSTASPLASK
ncbi:MAG TPA: hypothetical protein VG839_07635 [Asticcacaulis sp.]|nr:hypothetical protein [Asticcacaulis sp.]